MQSYTVIGIIQILDNGDWYERPVMQTVRASCRAGAREAVLATFGGFARWHTPELVRVTPGHA